MNLITSSLILQKALLLPFDPCTVEIENNKLKESSWITWASLQEHPEKKPDHHRQVLSLVQTAFDTSTDAIAKEKIARLSENPDCWYHSITDPIQRKKWTYTVTDSLELIQPIKVDGHFENRDEKIKDPIYSGMWKYFDGIFDTATEIDLSEIVAPMPPIARNENLRIHWLGHSTTLIQVSGINLLLDPFFEDLTLYTRYTPPGIALENLPLIDTILFSHNQSDHCDLNAMNSLQPFQPDVFTPTKMGSTLQKIGFTHVHEHSWWATSETDGIKISCVPARHWSYRFGENGANQSLWNGWVIEAQNQTIYFAGDTAYDEELFAQINEQFGPIDILLLPIAPEGRKESHLDLRGALEATRFFQPKKMIPIHWGVLRWGEEKIEAPLQNLQEHLKNAFSDLAEVVHILKIGEALELESPSVIEEKNEDSFDRSQWLYRDPPPPFID